MRGKAHRAAWLLGTLGGILTTGSGWSQEATVDDIIAAERERITVAQEQQQEITSIANRNRDLFQDYQTLVKEVETAQVFNEIQQRIVDAQNAEIANLQNSIANVQVIERQMLPLMNRMIAALDRFIELDVPFLLDERQGGVALLTDLIDDSDVTVAEKFRLVMEAWQFEIDYGTFNSTYGGRQDINGVMREVTYLQVGRIALAYLTPDELTAGYWDQANRVWVVADEETTRAIAQGVELVNSGNTSNAELLLIPVPPPEE